MLGLCLSPTDVDCTTPLPATGKGLSVWIPEPAEPDETLLRLRFQQTLPPPSFNGNQITVADKYGWTKTAAPCSSSTWARRIGHRDRHRIAAEVLVVNLDVFHPEASITLGDSDGWLEADFTTGDFRAETLRTGLSTMPATNALTANLQALTQHMLVSPAAAIVEEVPR